MPGQVAARHAGRRAHIRADLRARRERRAGAGLAGGGVGLRGLRRLGCGKSHAGAEGADGGRADQIAETGQRAAEAGAQAASHHVIGGFAGLEQTAQAGRRSAAAAAGERRGEAGRAAAALARHAAHVDDPFLERHRVQPIEENVFERILEPGRRVLTAGRDRDKSVMRGFVDRIPQLLRFLGGFLVRLQNIELRHGAGVALLGLDQALELRHLGAVQFQGLALRQAILRAGQALRLNRALGQSIGAHQLLVGGRLAHRGGVVPIALVLQCLARLLDVFRRQHQGVLGRHHRDQRFRFRDMGRRQIALAGFDFLVQLDLQFLRVGQLGIAGQFQLAGGDLFLDRRDQVRVSRLLLFRALVGLGVTRRDAGLVVGREGGAQQLARLGQLGGQLLALGGVIGHELDPGLGLGQGGGLRAGGLGLAGLVGQVQDLLHDFPALEKTVVVTHRRVLAIAAIERAQLGAK